MFDGAIDHEALFSPLLEHDDVLLYHLKQRKAEHDYLTERWCGATKHIPCLGNPPNWPDSCEHTMIMTWVGMEASFPAEREVGHDLDGDDVDDSDLEDLIKPEPPVLLISEFSRLIDGEDERFDDVDSDTDDVDINLE